MIRILLALVLAFIAFPASAALPVFYADSAGSTSNSGTTNTQTASIATCTGGTAFSTSTGCKGTGANWTTATTTVNLESNTNLSTLPVDGSQAIFLTNATNSNQKVFFITGVTGCTGSGSCSVTVSVAPTCSTCTAQNWTIGGVILLPDTNMEGALNAGSTISVNNNINCTATCITGRTAGDTTTGPITVTSTTTRAQLQAPSGSFFAISAATNEWVITNLTLTSLSTTFALVQQVGSSNVYTNNIFKIASPSGTGACLNITNGSGVIANNEFNGCNSNGITVGNTGTYYIRNNYFHGSILADGIAITSTNTNAIIDGNIIIGAGASSTGTCIHFSGTPSSALQNNVVSKNTCANWGQGGLVVGNAGYRVNYFNNIFYNNNLNGTTTYYNVSYPSSSQSDTSLNGAMHGCNVFFTTSGSFNLNNAVANSTESTSDPLFNNPGTDWGLQKLSPAVHTGCYQTPGGYSTTSNLIDMGALQTDVQNGGAGGGFIGNGGL